MVISCRALLLAGALVVPAGTAHADMLGGALGGALLGGIIGGGDGEQ